MSNNELLEQHLLELALVIENDEQMDITYYDFFIDNPELAGVIVDKVVLLNDPVEGNEKNFYQACVFAFEICISQLQAMREANNKTAKKCLDAIMDYLAVQITAREHSFNFWLPILSAFYDVHVELSQELKDAYFSLAVEDDDTEHEDEAPTSAIAKILDELADLSDYDIVDNFFAQSYALPDEYFADLVFDLYSLEQGQEIALLMLLHPKPEVREIVLSTINHIIWDVTLSSLSLTRLQTIKEWYPPKEHSIFDNWIKLQRKKGVTFLKAKKPAVNFQIRATEMDGTGAQGFFIELKKTKIKCRLMGFILKQNYGIKDVWLSPLLSPKEINYNKISWEDSVTLRKAEVDFMLLLINHFLAVGLEFNRVADLHMLEIQEELGLSFRPQKINNYELLEKLLIEIRPFTPSRITESLKRTKTWMGSKTFTESWYLESIEIDKIVNNFSTYQQGMRISDLPAILDAIFNEIFEPMRDEWNFRFLNLGLWLKSGAKKTEKTWEDALIVAHVISQGKPWTQIPIMVEICKRSIENSIETMKERRTYLASEN